MKKTIHDLIQKLKVTDSGKATGGFGSIRGGTAYFYQAQNDGNCSNGKAGGSGSCSGSNGGDCSNNVSCKDITNGGRCTNTYSGCGV